MENYKDFENIKLEDTGLFGKNPDQALNCLKKNNINNLAQLFNIHVAELDTYSQKILEQIQGIVYLLRYKYLKINLPFGPTLDSSIVDVNGKRLKDVKGNIEVESVARYLIKMGFSSHFATGIQWSFRNDDSLITSLQHTTDIILNKFCNPREKDCTKEKLRLIVHWYYDKYLPNQNKVSKYSVLKDVLVIDTGLVRPVKQDSLYVLLKKNNIENLEELFLADDEKHLNYITSGRNAKKLSIKEIEGTIRLLRYKYLFEKPPFDNILETDIVKGHVYKDHEVVLNGLYKNLTSLGLPAAFSDSLSTYLACINYCSKIKTLLIDICNHKSEYSMYCSKFDFEIAISKIELILEIYNCKIISDIEEAKNKLRELNQKLEKLKNKQMAIESEIINTDTEIRDTEALIKHLVKNKDLSENS